MRFREAMQALLDGKQVRLPAWSEHTRVGFGKGGELSLFSELHPRGTLTSVSQGEAASDNWELYEPQPPKMTLVEAVAVVIREGGGTISRRGDADSDEDGVCFCADDVQADDWEVVP